MYLAEEQTAGRGRGANSWEFPRSTGIYCSSILRPALPPSEVLVLSLAAGLAVQAAIRQVDSRVTPDLKWPNDLLIDGKKVCGLEGGPCPRRNKARTRASNSEELEGLRHIVVGAAVETA